MQVKTAFISGGASGMGRLHAIRLANEGFAVAIADLNETALKETARLAPSITPYLCDVSDLAQVQSVVAEVVGTHGPIDRLVRCAAIMPGGLLLDHSAEDVGRVMQVNHIGMTNVCQTVLPDMVARNEGEVVLYGSTAGLMPVPRFGTYGVTKAANNFYARVLIAENKSKVRIMLVCPPAVNTPLLEQAKEGPPLLHSSFARRFLTVQPGWVVDAVEKSLRRGKKVCYPGFLGRLIAFVSWFT